MTEQQEKAMPQIALEVQRLFEERDDLSHLCGTILATLSIPENKEAIQKIGHNFPAIVAGWNKLYHDIIDD